MRCRMTLMPPCAATGHRWQFWAQLPNGGILWVCGDCGAERECDSDVDRSIARMRIGNGGHKDG